MTDAPTDVAGAHTTMQWALPRVSLRNRIVLAFVVFGLLLSSGFAGLAYFAMEDFEGIVVRQLLQSETQRVIEVARTDPDNPLPASRRMFARRVPLAQVSRLPVALRRLQPGVHVLDQDGEHETYVEVRDADARRYFFFIDLGAVAERERFVQWLLAAIVIVGTLASAALGLLFSGYLIRPVRRLVRLVDASTPQRPRVALAPRFVDDEVGALAAAFDRYQQRLEGFLRREREFTADASHELRAPLSVIQAGLDLLAEDTGVSPRGQRALERMQRRAAEFKQLLDALLYLARAESDPDGVSMDIPLLQSWEGLRDEHARTDPARAGTIRVMGDRRVHAMAPPRIANLVFRQLLGQALGQAGDALVCITIAPDHIAIGPWDGSTRDPGSQGRSDERFGVALVARLCDRLGWTLQASGDGKAWLSLPGHDASAHESHRDPTSAAAQDRG